ncbi:MAG TPA: MFS transporter [Candidatus Acidoferrum sp.]|nr:MFS transporter [Candidatus Acidoferrum sp.]
MVVRLIPRINEYSQRLRTFSRSSKLFLVATVFQGLGSGIWGVIFYYYLLEVGFQTSFVGNMFTASAIAAGLIALLAGLFCERIGPKRAILIGATANLVNLAQILVLQPTSLLLASLASGLIGTISSVASAPFMVENSNPEERTYLFSFQSTLGIIMAVIGAATGGFMPDLFNARLGLPTGLNGSPVGYRISLAISIAISLAAVFPILFVKQNKRLAGQRMADLLSLRNIKSSKTIIKFMIPTALIGFGAGFIVPLVNPFFRNKLKATQEQVGIITSISNITLGIATLVTPALSRRLSKARVVVLCEYLSMPFIMLTAFSPTVAWASSSYIVRTALMNMAGPVGTAFQMESVTPAERATTSGLMLMSDSIPRAVTASISGVMMTNNDYFSPFLYMTIAYFVASTIYYAFFWNAETKKAKTSSNEG